MILVCNMCALVMYVLMLFVYEIVVKFLVICSCDTDVSWIEKIKEAGVYC